VELKNLQQALLDLINSETPSTQSSEDKIRAILLKFLTDEEWRLWSEGKISDPVSIGFRENALSKQVPRLRINLALIARSFLIKTLGSTKSDYDLECHFLHDPRTLRFSGGQFIANPSGLIFPKNSPILHSSNGFEDQNFQEIPNEFVKFMETGRLRPGVSAHFQFDSLPGHTWFASARFSASLGNGTIILTRNFQSAGRKLYRKWGLFLLGLIISLAIFFKIKSRILKVLSEEISDCLSFVIAEKREPFSKENIKDELTLLKHEITGFDQTIANRLLSYHLQLGLQRILNTPSKEMNYYLEEADYFVRDLDYDLRWNLRQAPKPEDDHVILVPLDRKLSGFVKNKLQISLPFQAEFKTKIKKKAELAEVFTGFFRNLIEKCSLQEDRLKSQTLEAELSIARQVQAKLGPLNLDEDSEVCKFFYSTEGGGESSNRFGSCASNPDGFRFYLGCISRTGIVASLSAIHLKSYLDILTQKEAPLELIFEQVNQKLFEEKSLSQVELLYGSFQKSTGILQLGCSGSWILQSRQNSQIITRNMSQPHLGQDQKNCFSPEKLILQPGDCFYAFHLDQGIRGWESHSSSILAEGGLSPDQVYSQLETGILNQQPKLQLPTIYQHFLGYLCD